MLGLACAICRTNWGGLRHARALEAIHGARPEPVRGGRTPHAPLYSPSDCSMFLLIREDAVRRYLEI
jgi:hypothetical protein